MSVFDSIVEELRVAKGWQLSEEQMQFAKGFGDDAICFADPGVGKTFTLEYGILYALFERAIPASKIYVSSFTNNTVGEIKYRYDEMCSVLKISNKVSFLTIHKRCLDILEKYGHLIRIHDVKSGLSNSTNFGEASTDELVVKDLSVELGRNYKDWMIKRIVNCINSLNSKLIFDEDHIKEMPEFKQLKMSVNEFNAYRECVYEDYKVRGTSSVSLITILTLELLLRFPDVAKEIQKDCELYIVDEFQDMSLLTLKVASLISKRLVVVGDIKQQIYGFNGSCSNIVEEFYSLHPNAKTFQIGQSRRCHNEIAEFATKIVLDNKVGGENFTGVGEGGSVTIAKINSYEEIIDIIETKFDKKTGRFPESQMMLFRNNFSQVGVLEYLYRKKLPARCKDSFTDATKLPVIRDFMQLIEIALSQGNRYDARNLKKYFRYEADQVFWKLEAEVVNQDTSLFDVQLRLNSRDRFIWESVLDKLNSIKKMVATKVTVDRLIGELYDLYVSIYGDKAKIYLPIADIDYYIETAHPCFTGQTYYSFKEREEAKREFVESCNAASTGVLLYTMHSSKGLEAHDVYILEADSAAIPNPTKHNDLLEKGCIYEAAKFIRDERFLLYVAATRAIKNLHISYFKELSPLLKVHEPRESWIETSDDYYHDYDESFKDIEAFIEFTKSDYTERINSLKLEERRAI